MPLLLGMDALKNFAGFAPSQVGKGKSPGGEN